MHDPISNDATAFSIRRSTDRITLELNDTYTIDFMKFDKTTNDMKVIKHIPMQYFDEMGYVIDNFVEYIEEYGNT